MDDATTARVIALEQAHPGWMCWTWRHWEGAADKITWCARRHDDGKLIETDTEEQLRAALAQAAPGSAKEGES